MKITFYEILFVLIICITSVIDSIVNVLTYLRGF
jgi:hypothetical protein